MERGNKNNGLQEQINSVNLSIIKHNRYKLFQMLYFSLVFLEPFIKLKADAAAVVFSE